MFQKFIAMFRHKEIRNRILFTITIFLIYRLGAAIPVPKIDSSALLAGMNENSLLGMLNLLGGGNFERFSIFAMGVGPYITASIVIQLLSMDVIPYLTDLTKTGGAEGRRKIDQITRYFGLILAFAQAYAMTYAFNVGYHILVDGKISTYLYVATILTAGTMFLLWVADRISMFGIGNGISMIIFAGIISNYPTMFANIFRVLVGGSGDTPASFTGLLYFLAYITAFLIIIVGVIIMSNAVRKIPIQYTSSNMGRARKDVNFLPLRINSASVTPVIFASAVMTAPLTIISFFKTTKFSETLALVLDTTKPWGLGIYVVLIILFTFFYTNLQVDPATTAENLNKNGTYIPGIRPGVETKEYITKVLNRITVMGALSIAFLGALPHLISMLTPLPQSFALGGTGIIIVVGIAQETVTDLLGKLTTTSYKSFKRGL